MMESYEHWRIRSVAYTSRVWIERLFDTLVLSCVVMAPAGLLFALYQAATGVTLGLVAGLIVAAGGALGIYARLIQPFVLRVKRIEIRATGAASHSRPLKIAFFSDIHVGWLKQRDWVRKVVALVNAQQPDIVLLGGDFVSNVDPTLVPGMLAPLSQIRARLGAYAVLGNHDYGLPGLDLSAQLEMILKENNVRLLRNECVTLDGRLQLVGIDELWSHRADIGAAFGECGDQNLPRVVLGHNPDLMTHITQKAELFIFGHTHGGQVYLPGLTKHIVPVESTLYRGQYKLPQGLVYVSNGCGETSTPTRLGAPVEVVAVTLYC
jgi:predicted MPP superfamily phosphohydrolase